VLGVGGLEGFVGTSQLLERRLVLGGDSLELRLGDRKSVV